MLRDRYVLGRTLAENESAAVIEAADRRMRRAVAVKLFDPSASEALPYAEARLAAIDHPNLCKVLDADHENDVPFVILERLTGETFAEALATRKPYPIREAIEIAMQLLSALDAVHERGIVHRDVKPANIFLVPRPGCLPVVKLFDFATSIRQGEPGFGQGHVGTRSYMAPEQVKEGEIDGRADLFAVGVLLFEALAGQRPFMTTSYDALFSDLVRRPSAELTKLAPHVTPDLAAVITRAMEPVADRRFASAREFQAALGKVRVDPGSGIHPKIQRAQHSSATKVEVPSPQAPPKQREKEREKERESRPKKPIGPLFMPSSPGGGVAEPTLAKGRDDLFRRNYDDNDTGPTNVLHPHTDSGAAISKALPSSKAMPSSIPYTPTRLSPVGLVAAPRAKEVDSFALDVTVPAPHLEPMPTRAPLMRASDATAPFVAQTEADAQRSLHHAVPAPFFMEPIATSAPLPYVPPSPPSSRTKAPTRSGSVPRWAIGIAIFCGLVVIALATAALLFF